MAWENEKKRIRTALNLVSAELPYLAGLAAIADVHFDERMSTAGVFASGKMLISPKFMETLNRAELGFVVAHELMHLFLRTHERMGNSSQELVNIAHDFIINDKLICLRESSHWSDYGVSTKGVPANGLDWNDYRDKVSGWKPASEYSLEELVSVLRKLRQDRKANFENTPHWKAVQKTGSSWDPPLTPLQVPRSKTQSKPLPKTPSSSTFGDLLAAAGITLPESEESTGPQDEKSLSGKPGEEILSGLRDVFSEEMEQQCFPNVSLTEIREAQKEVKETIVRAYAELEAHDAFKKMAEQYSIGGGAGNYSREYSLLRSAYEVPWETALQHWFDATAPGQRSWARPSRRGAFRTDVVLPGRTREGWTLHIVLDTSGSMGNILPTALGAIAHFCEANNVSEVRIIQIDTVIHADEFVPVEKLEGYKILGLGGNDMQPAWDRLMEDPEIEAVVVVSDGGFNVPPEPPFEVLWAILEDGWNSRSFNPAYGTVVFISQNR